MCRNATRTRYIFGSAECDFVPFIETIVVCVCVCVCVCVLLKTGIHESLWIETVVSDIHCQICIHKLSLI